MMVRFILLLSLFIVGACAPQRTSSLPSSERLMAIKQTKLSSAQQSMTSHNLQFGAPVFIRIFKYENVLEAWVKDKNAEQYRLYKTYPICNYSGALGPKIAEGDKQAPEGFYMVTADQLNPWSNHQLSFNLGFPNEYDAALGRTGSALMVHGGCSSVGCYAMTDPVVEDIYLMVEASIESGNNVPVHIFPFRMTVPAMIKHQYDPWYAYWYNLKQGYDAFELTKIPPKVHTQISYSPQMQYGQNLDVKYTFTMPEDLQRNMIAAN